MRALFPIDGSQATYDALDHGLALLKGIKGLEVTLLNVRQKGFDNVADQQYVDETFEADEDDEVFPSEQSSQRALTRAADIANKHGVKASTTILQGRYKDEILNLSGEFDLLVMHRLSKSSLKDAVKGSATEDIARNAACSVMLVDARQA